MSLKLDLVGAAAEASQQGLSADAWKGGADNRDGTPDQASLISMLKQCAVSAVGRVCWSNCQQEVNPVCVTRVLAVVASPVRANKHTTKRYSSMSFKHRPAPMLGIQLCCKDLITFERHACSLR